MEKCCSDEQTSETFANMINVIAENFQFIYDFVEALIIDNILSADWKDIVLGKEGLRFNEGGGIRDVSSFSIQKSYLTPPKFQCFSCLIVIKYYNDYLQGYSRRMIL